MGDKRKFVNHILIAVIVAFIGATACRRDTKPFEIGVVLPLSGEVRVYSMDVMKGIEIGFEEINLIKGVRGKDLKAIYLDANQSEEALKQKLTTMISERGIVVFVTIDKKATALLCSISAKQNPVIFSDWREMDETCEQTLYAITPQPYREGKLLGRLACKELKSNRAFLLTIPEDTRTARFAEGFSQGYHVEGGRSLNIMQYTEEMKEAHPLELIMSFNVDLAVIASFDEPSHLVRGMRNAGFTGNILISQVAGELMQTECDLDTFKKVFYPVTEFSPDSKERINREFQDRYQAKFNKKANYTASVFYDLAEIIAYMLEINGDDTRRMHRFLGKLRDYNAITGQTSYFPDGEVEKPLKLKEIR